MKTADYHAACAELGKSMKRVDELVEGYRVRIEVREFAELMESALAANDAKKGDSWKAMSSDHLLERLEGEVVELLNAQDSDDRRSAAFEAIDVANFAMMFYHACHRELGHEICSSAAVAEIGGDDGTG
ncbi:MAG: hypothetical protein V3V08_07455 [Nannocystaceae bacterium]